VEQSDPRNGSLKRGSQSGNKSPSGPKYSKLAPTNINTNDFKNGNTINVGNTDDDTNNNNNNGNDSKSPNMVVFKVDETHLTEIKVKSAYENFIKNTERLRDLVDKCSDLATHLSRDEESRVLLLNECENFCIDYKEVYLPSPGMWRSQIRCLKSILDLKAAIFFAGESDEKFERNCPTVEQFQLLEKVVPVLDKLDSSFHEANFDDLKRDFETIQVSKL